MGQGPRERSTLGSRRPTCTERNFNDVIVGYVVPKSPAEKSGIMQNDIIIKVGNKDIELNKEYSFQQDGYESNKTVRLYRRWAAGNVALEGRHP